MKIFEFVIVDWLKNFASTVWISHIKIENPMRWKDKKYDGKTNWTWEICKFFTLNLDSSLKKSHRISFKKTKIIVNLALV